MLILGLPRRALFATRAQHNRKDRECLSPPRKDPKPKLQVCFLLNTCCFPTVVKLKKIFFSLGGAIKADSLSVLRPGFFWSIKDKGLNGSCQSRHKSCATRTLMSP